MSASVVQAFYHAMRSMDPPLLAASFTDDVVIVEPRHFRTAGRPKAEVFQRDTPALIEFFSRNGPVA